MCACVIGGGDRTVSVACAHTHVSPYVYVFTGVRGQGARGSRCVCTYTCMVCMLFILVHPDRVHWGPLADVCSARVPSPPR